MRVSMLGVSVTLFFAAGCDHVASAPDRVVMPPRFSVGASAAASFFEDFEGDLVQWIGKGGGAHQAVIVSDPIRSGNRVLSFTGLNAAGDIFSSEVSITPAVRYVLSFEYLGLPDRGGVPGDLGGFIGVAEQTPGTHRWLAGTALAGGGETDPLIDDGQWRSYSIEFDPAQAPPGFPFLTGSVMRVMVEDFSGSGGVAGDALFDNIRLRSAVVDVAIDIKPGSLPNSINPTSKGVIPVAILTTESFDATTVDPGTVLFGVTGTEATPVHSALEDVDGDGDADMILHFNTQSTGIQCGDTSASLTGRTFTAQMIDGVDSINTVGCE